MEHNGTEHEKIFKKFLRKHIACVQEAGRKLGVPQEQLDNHDLSKWSAEEFPAYAKRFCGNSIPNEFAMARLHHYHLNPHHWQHFIFPDGYTPKGSNLENGVVQMPENYALEMVADWMGETKVRTNSWDMTDWLKVNMFSIRVHSTTAEFLYQVLDELGYGNEQRFLTELQKG